MTDDVTMAELARSMQRIESKLDQAIGDHEKRLRRLEQWVWTAAGAGGVGALSGISALLGG